MPVIGNKGAVIWPAQITLTLVSDVLVPGHSHVIESAG